MNYANFAAFTAAFFLLCAPAQAQSIKRASEEDLIKIARSAAPQEISGGAAVMVPGPDGRLKTVVEGTNGFTCIPDLSGQEVPDPVCADRAALAWLTSMLDKAPAPSNAAPGIAYMAQGGWHWEKDGTTVMDPATPGAKRVKEPPHWMVLWPIDQQEAALPDRPGRFGTYVMYPGTPYAHLMIHQDPMKLARK